MSLYYFVASLPTLSLTGKPPVTVEEFLADARRIVGDEFGDQLEVLLGTSATTTTNRFVRRWLMAERQLGLALARARAARLGVDAGEYQNAGVPFGSEAERAVVEAMAKSNPLEREQSLDRFRWTLLDDWTRSTPFGEAYVFAYALKLKMAHRWARLTEESGYSRLEETVTRVRGASAA